MYADYQTMFLIRSTTYQWYGFCRALLVAVYACPCLYNLLGLNLPL